RVAPEPALVTQALARSGGNPLFLRWYLAAHRRAPAAADLGDSLESYRKTQRAPGITRKRVPGGGAWRTFPDPGVDGPGSCGMLPR
ncbi:MAG TPA: hypothetical protein VNL71_21325, partial [Chloroflexota bacterium]|nr:hypothetical protein [Chloroflexota bacterium]